jgi:Tol biopolymer transport system component
MMGVTKVRSMGQNLFISEHNGNTEIYVMNVEGRGQTRLTNNIAEDEIAVW